MDFGYLNQGLELAAPLPTRCPSGRPIDICISLKRPKNMWDIIFNHNPELGSYNYAVLPVVAVAVAVDFGKNWKNENRGRQWKPRSKPRHYRGSIFSIFYDFPFAVARFRGRGRGRGVIIFDLIYLSI